VFIGTALASIASRLSGFVVTKIMLERNEKGQFLKGGNLGNQNAKGNKPNKTSFKKGEHKSLETEFKKGKMSEKQLGKNNSYWKGGVTKTKYCIDCGKKLIDYYAKRCKKCFGISKRGENHHNWLGGKSFEPYTTDWTKSLKRSIRERDKYICQICNRQQEEVVFCVHHIDYNKLNCNPNNLITLCRSCHVKTNINREYWKKYFNKYL
jgi:hypothetical protein